MTMLCKKKQRITFSGLATPAREDIQPRKKNQFSNLALALLQPLGKWLDSLEIQNPRVAKFIVKAIPGQCPFERDIMLFGRKVGHIPPMCKLNPLYDEFVGLRFRALCYLADLPNNA